MIRIGGPALPFDVRPAAGASGPSPTSSSITTSRFSSKRAHRAGTKTRSGGALGRRKQNLHVASTAVVAAEPELYAVGGPDFLFVQLHVMRCDFQIVVGPRPARLAVDLDRAIQVCRPPVEVGRDLRF